MSIVKPFRAVRPAPDLVDQIAALPYDVYSSKEARLVVADKPNSFLKIDRAETFFDVNIPFNDSRVYEKARQVLYAMMDEGAFVQERQPAFYLYELTMGNRSQTGLVARTSVDEYQQDLIKKHEKTRADKEEDRINHVDICDANTGPIFLTYKANPSIGDLLLTFKKDHQPLYDFTADDAVIHRVWLIENQELIGAIEEAFKGVDSLYIADGHHRAASAVKVAMKRREANPDYDGSEAFNYFLSVIFPDEELAIMDYNRVVTDLNGLSKSAYLSAVKESFEILKEQTEPISPSSKATFGMYLEGKWYLLKAKEGSYDGTDPVLSLDVSILQLNLLSPILGIGDPRVDKRIDFVGGIRGLKELERRVHDDMEVAFSMFPTSIDELMAIADAGKLMPPKSTWFEPKLRSGIFIHLLH